MPWIVSIWTALKSRWKQHFDSVLRGAKNAMLQKLARATWPVKTKQCQSFEMEMEPEEIDLKLYSSESRWQMSCNCHTLLEQLFLGAIGICCLHPESYWPTSHVKVALSSVDTHLQVLPILFYHVWARDSKAALSCKILWTTSWSFYPLQTSHPFPFHFQETHGCHFGFPKVIVGYELCSCCKCIAPNNQKASTAARSRWSFTSLCLNDLKHVTCNSFDSLKTQISNPRLVN